MHCIYFDAQVEGRQYIVYDAIYKIVVFEEKQRQQGQNSCDGHF
jgi:hypothetical protein